MTIGAALLTLWLAPLLGLRSDLQLLGDSPNEHVSVPEFPGPVRHALTFVVVLTADHAASGLIGRWSRPSRRLLVVGPLLLCTVFWLVPVPKAPGREGVLEAALCGTSTPANPLIAARGR